MEGFVHELDFVEEVEPATAVPVTLAPVSPAPISPGPVSPAPVLSAPAADMAAVQTCPAAYDDTIRTYRGLVFGLPVAVGLWAAIIGVSAYLIA